MMLHLYNSLNNRKELFNPIDAGKVRMYVCGITVYDFCHIGHARMMVVFDTVYRYLQASGYEVVYVRNITDIDDKIIKRATDNSEDFRLLTQRYIAAMDEDLGALSVLRPTHEPKATEHIPTIIAMIAALLKNGYAYRADNQDIYYAVKNFASYGKLSGKKLEDLCSGARVEIDELKRDPLDFVLWKAAKPGEPAWDSPWGKGRPGWHIECSAMSTEILGAHFDIHGGGQDLQFPHHENEIAQSEACYGNERFVNYWMHNGFVRVNEEKMSKSLGNFFTIREVLKLYKAEEIRYFILSSHYRSQLNYSDEQLNSARAALSRLYTAMRGVVVKDASDDFAREYRERFAAAMDDDLNTPEALAVLFELAHVLNRGKAGAAHLPGMVASLLKTLGGVLGILQSDPESYLQSGSGAGSDLGDREIDQLVEQRRVARAAKNWSESDRIRDVLAKSGVVLEDGAQGTLWRRS